jgi:hypothetical protein
VKTVIKGKELWTQKAEMSYLQKRMLEGSLGKERNVTLGEAAGQTTHWPGSGECWLGYLLTWDLQCEPVSPSASPAGRTSAAAGLTPPVP